MTRIKSTRDLLLWELEAAVSDLREAMADISPTEYDWEPLSPSERRVDCLMPPERKRVWRVFAKDDRWTYDYTPESLDPPPFTTIAWIINHISQSADMYLYCIQSGLAEGVERTWDDLPVPANLELMRMYLEGILAAVRAYLVSIPHKHVNAELNKLTPAPWGEMRPTVVNLWGGIIEHAIQHSMQIAARKDAIRNDY